MYTIYDTPYASHHGILGQRWGVRRFQNPDGSLTDAGRKRVNKQLKAITDKSGSFSKESIKKALKLKPIDNEYESVRKRLVEKIEANEKAISNLKPYADEYGKEANKYALAAGITNDAMYRKKNVSDVTLKDLSEYAFGYMHDDLDQGTVNSKSLYVESHLNKAYIRDNLNAISDFRHTLYDEGDKVCQRVLDDYRQYSPGSIKRLIGVDAHYLVKEAVEQLDTSYDKLNYFNYDIDKLSSSEVDTGKQAISVVKSISSKKAFEDMNYWPTVYDAIDSIPSLANKKVSSFTASDWQKVDKLVEEEQLW